MAINDRTPPATPDLESLVEDASDVFWSVVADHYPPARTGDLSPSRTIAFENAAAEAVHEWIGNNAPDLCQTCGSAIVWDVNESNFVEGECGPCEYQRYGSQPKLLVALDYVLQQTVDLDLAHGIELTEGEHEVREQALAAIAAADGPGRGERH
jgi:hypothetical protein